MALERLASTTPSIQERLRSLLVERSAANAAATPAILERLLIVLEGPDMDPQAYAGRNGFIWIRQGMRLIRFRDDSGSRLIFEPPQANAQAEAGKVLASWTRQGMRLFRKEDGSLQIVWVGGRVA